MMRGIDVSNWQEGINPEKLDIDFCICKATEGTSFVDPFCDTFIQKLIKAKKLFGYYHFAGKGNPKEEAKFFWNNTLGYTGSGIPVLDYETWDYAGVHFSWCEKFMFQYHELSNVWPILYISASHVGEFSHSWIPSKCGLWIAGYNRDYDKWPAADDMPYDVSPWEFAAIWQFASDFKLKGYRGDLDADLAFMDANAWLKYAGAKVPANSFDKAKDDAKKVKSCEELADEVIAGMWGKGWNRKNALDSAYGKGTYDHVQIIVNNRLGLDGC